MRKKNTTDRWNYIFERLHQEKERIKGKTRKQSPAFLISCHNSVLLIFGGKVKWSEAAIHFWSAGTHSSVLRQMAFHFVKLNAVASLRGRTQPADLLEAAAGPSYSCTSLWLLFSACSMSKQLLAPFWHLFFSSSSCWQGLWFHVVFCCIFPYCNLF